MFQKNFFCFVNRLVQEIHAAVMWPQGNCTVGPQGKSGRDRGFGWGAPDLNCNRVEWPEVIGLLGNGMDGFDQE